ncbi:MAG TPA: tetraacyldisaccharide 4'-kinase [Nitrospiraceae bacterium]|nr:tetraacyldisaccharide 4'-kinase [Nitrospiraceae bacterium]
MRHQWIGDPQPWMRPLLQFMAVPYGLVVRARNLLYDHGWNRVQRLPCRVVSIGNVTVGGTGKTPVVIWIADFLSGRGVRVGVLSRGYRRKSDARHLVVSDGRTLLASPTEAGDEPYLIATRCPRAVVAVGADRYRLGRWVLNQFSLDCLLLDDGFQHRALHRDVDILLVDASVPHALDALLPAGQLREPLSAVRRASAIVLTRVDAELDVAAARARLTAANDAEIDPILIRFDADAYVDVATGKVYPLQDAVDRPVVLFSGIGNAGSFRRLVSSLGVSVRDEVIFPDHHAYTKADMEKVRERVTQSGSTLLLTTEKDAVKIASLIDPDETVWAVRLSTEIVSGRERLERMLMMSAE